jgi:hypothetical protein
MQRDLEVHGSSFPSNLDQNRRARGARNSSTHTLEPDAPYSKN